MSLFHRLCFQCALIVFIFYIADFSILAQNNTSSPYSSYGVGDIEPIGFGKVLGMGGAGYGLTSGTFLNNTNPASYVGIDSTSSVFEIGIFGQQSKLESNSLKRTDYSANFKYLALGFKIYKWWGMSLGVLPYSSVGYNISTVYTIEGTNEPYTVIKEGSGGLTQFYMANSFNLNQHISVGINMSGLFGPINQTESYLIGNSSVATVLGSHNYYLHRIYFDYGIQYRFKIDKLKCTAGAVFANKQELKSKYSNQLLLNTGDTLIMNSSAMENFSIPGKIGVGIAATLNDKYTAALDYTSQFWSKKLGSDASLVNGQQVNFGLEYAPSDFRHKQYMKIMNYRIGGYYKSTYLELRGNQIKQYGMSLGVGLPINSLHSMVNVSLELGQRGTTKNNLIKENYTLIHVGFTLNEQWFVRRKYD